MSPKAREGLRRKRLEKGMSQTFIAKKLGFKYPSSYANIEYGIRNPSIKNAILIAEILESDVKELFFD